MLNKMVALFKKTRLVNLTSLALLYYCFLSTQTFGALSHTVKKPLYVGLSAGYGNTTWEGLVPPLHKQNIAMSMSTPKQVEEGGGVWGVFAGYELMPYLAIETSYLHYHNAEVTFDENSIFAFDRDGMTTFTTRTETISLTGKIMMFFPRSEVRAYSSFGYTEMHRQDLISAHWIPTPTFGAGINYNFSEHVMGEFGGTFTTGKGQSELNPVEDYYPFLYAVVLRLAYRI